MNGGVAQSWPRRLRRRVHFILDGGASGDRLALAVHRGLIALVALSVVAVILESTPALAAQFGPMFRAIEFTAVGAFTFEYLLRVWCAPDHTPFAALTPFRARLAFVRSGTALIDLLTVLPAYLSIFTDVNDLRALLFLRLLRFFKLARYSPGMRSLVAVLETERKALAASSVLLFGVVLFAATAMHVVEHRAQPDAFGSIPAAMWWAIQTICTVGYGDVTPVTLLGRIIAALTMVTGFVMLGLPVGIVATGFAEEIHRREFVVTWSMVASVPLFRSLDAPAIAEIMRYLRAQTAPEGELIVRRGDVAHSMYFIASGKVEIELPYTTAYLGEGQFFGEVAVLRKTRRSANVRALEATKLLILDAFDLHTFMQRNPEIGQQIEAVAASRAELAPKERHGDLIDAELRERDNPTRDPG